MFVVFEASHAAQGGKKYDSSGNYIKDCEFATCGGLAAMRWSENNPFGLAVAVSVGTKPAVTDDHLISEIALIMRM
jgi:hypothetical protein